MSVRDLAVAARLRRGVAGPAVGGPVRPAGRGAASRLVPSGRAATSRRRSYSIRAYVGPNGAGKSLAAIHDLLPSLALGRPVLSNVTVLLPATDATIGGDRTHPLWEPLTDFRQFLSWKNGEVLFDEVTGVASSRESAGLPVQVANHLVQLRRDDVTLSYTSPNYARADLIIREVTQLVVYCTGHLPAKRQDESGRMWRDRRLSLWRGYDAKEFDKFTTGKRQAVKPVCRQWFWRPGSDAESSYDTYAPVSVLGVANMAGLCIVCGGKRSHPRCDCTRSVFDLGDLVDGALVDPLDAVAAPVRRVRRTVPGPVVHDPVTGECAGHD